MTNDPHVRWRELLACSAAEGCVATSEVVNSNSLHPEFWHRNSDEHER